MSSRVLSILRSLNKNKNSCLTLIQQASRTLSFTQTTLAKTEDSNPRRVRIYTKTGDKGVTSLFTGERRSKNDVIFNALGNSDELNSSLGLAREFCLDIASKNPNLQETSEKIQSKLIKIQSTLLDIGSHLATPKSSATQKQLERIANFDSKLTVELELWIDEFESELPVLKNFILPSGGKCSSCLHLARSICRRLERSIQPILQANDVDPNVQIYVNRLSDFLFVCARYVSMKEGKDEIVYKKSS